MDEKGEEQVKEEETEEMAYRIPSDAERAGFGAILAFEDAFDGEICPSGKDKILNCRYIGVNVEHTVGLIDLGKSEARKGHFNLKIAIDAALLKKAIKFLEETDAEGCYITFEMNSNGNSPLLVRTDRETVGLLIAPRIED